MGRYDALTQIEAPRQPNPTSVVTPPSDNHLSNTGSKPLQEAKKTTKPQNRLSTNQSPTPDVAEKVKNPAASSGALKTNRRGLVVGPQLFRLDGMGYTGE
jgi:hypothetical protein